ncbi:Uncharacterised protein [Shigella sonnei]|nr:Uncharacterised protein [Shigella sonnei]CSS55248.1 Uncharacterised protein [Shigella sonnei]
MFKAGFEQGFAQVCLCHGCSLQNTYWKLL